MLLFHMQWQEVLLTLAVVGLSVLIPAEALRILLVRGIRRLRGIHAPPRSAFKRWRHRVVLALAGVELACFAWAYFVEPYWPEVTHARIVSDKLSGSRAVRLVLISDTHCEEHTRLEDRIPEIIAELKPDAIFFTGDMLNTPGGAVNFRWMMKRLAVIAPTYAVRGNWDGKISTAGIFDGTGVRELRNEWVEQNVSGSDVWIGGGVFGEGGPIHKMLAHKPPTGFTVFLYHSPDLAKWAASTGGDLFCSGHTHGGQVALPFYGALVSIEDENTGRTFASGLYQIDNTYCYNNRGIGMEGRFCPPVRFLARPEITLIELVPQPLSRP
jgi:predicted MPP superfamily phosphohydrolase